MSSTIFHSLSIILLVLALFLYLRDRLKWFVIPIPIYLIIVLLLLVIPVKSLPALYYFRALFGDLSILGTVFFLHMICIYTFHNSIPKRYTEHCLSESLTNQLFLVVLGSVLYVTALGFGRFDIYALGYGHPLMYILIGLICFTLYCLKAKFIFIAWITSVAIYTFTLFVDAFSIFESNNLWDYLIDPVIWFIAVVKLSRRSAQQKIFNTRENL